jgi:hypothetical protein
LVSPGHENARLTNTTSSDERPTGFHRTGKEHAMSGPVEPTGVGKVYRLEPIADEHVAASRRMIRSAAARTRQRRALVLGPGRCQEIPLAELAAQFDEVLLADQDYSVVAAGLAAADLPAESHAKLELRVADLTGLAGPLVRGWQSAVSAATDAQDAIGRMSAVVDEAQPVMLGTLRGARFDLVVASCLISQLTATAIRQAGEIFAGRFASDLGALHAAPRWLASLDQLGQRTDSRFMSWLLKLVAPQGRIYFAETVRTCLTELAPDGSWTTAGFYRMTRSLDLGDYVDARFQIEERGRWTWVSLVPQAGQNGKCFDVQALTLGVTA